MFGKLKTSKVFLTALLGVALMGQPATAQAMPAGRYEKPKPKVTSWGWGRHVEHRRPYNYHHRYPVGRFEVALPHGYIEISFRGGRYYFGGGCFYRREPRGYLIVPPPVGMVVYRIPSGYERVVINGVDYYTYSGVYYQEVPAGYQVVAPPTTVVVEPSTVVLNTPARPEVESFTVNIPNNRNSFTPVVIKRSGNGFVGPQGEFYPEFPKVEQLRVMYGK